MLTKALTFITIMAGFGIILGMNLRNLEVAATSGTIMVLGLMALAIAMSREQYDNEK